MSIATLKAALKRIGEPKVSIETIERLIDEHIAEDAPEGVTIRWTVDDMAASFNMHVYSVFTIDELLIADNQPYWEEALDDLHDHFDVSVGAETATLWDHVRGEDRLMLEISLNAYKSLTVERRKAVKKALKAKVQELSRKFSFKSSAERVLDHIKEWEEEQTK